MMVVAPQITAEEIGMSLGDFILQFGEAPFELWDGEIIEMNPQILRSTLIAKRLFRQLDRFVEEHQLGEVLWEAPFVLKSGKQWVKGARVPDLMFVTAKRISQLKVSDEEWDISPLPFAPDLAIEVMSPTDRLATMKRKIKRYLEDGVLLAWIIDPDRRAVFVYTATIEVVLTDEDHLTGGEVLPDFELEIAKLFEG